MRGRFALRAQMWISKTAFRFRRSIRSSDKYAVRVKRKTIPAAGLPDRFDSAFKVFNALPSSVVSFATRIESVKDGAHFFAFKPA